MNKKAQEEMVGFALIMIIVAVILLIFLAFALRKPPEDIGSYEVDSFIQSFLPFTTGCESQQELLTVQKLISSCGDSKSCEDGREACGVLRETLEEITIKSWELSDIAGYNLTIYSNEEVLTSIGEGNVTNSYKSSFQDFSRGGGDSVTIFFTAYY